MDAIADNLSHTIADVTLGSGEAESGTTNLRLLERQLSQLAALTELIARIGCADTAEAACQILADQLQNHWSADAVFVGLCRVGSPACRLAAISGVATFHRDAEHVQAAQAVLQEAIARGETARWPVANVADGGGLMAHKQFAASRDSDSTIVSSPLRDPRGW
jgi:predicted metal-binding protein